MMGELFAYPLLMLMAFVCWVVAREQNEKRRVKEAREYLAAMRGGK
jgi:preprotein translocase subunit YajC